MLRAIFYSVGCSMTLKPDLGDQEILTALARDVTCCFGSLGVQWMLDGMVLTPLRRREFFLAQSRQRQDSTMALEAAISAEMETGTSLRWCLTMEAFGGPVVYDSVVYDCTEGFLGGVGSVLHDMARFETGEGSLA